MYEYERRILRQLKIDTVIQKGGNKIISIDYLKNMQSIPFPTKHKSKKDTYSSNIKQPKLVRRIKREIS